MMWVKGFSLVRQGRLERIARSLEAIETALAIRSAATQDLFSISDDPSDDGSDWDCHDTGPYALG